MTGNMPSLKRDEDAQKKGASPEERHYYAMTRMRGWKQFDEFAKNLLEDLDNINAIAMSQGMGFEDMGRNAVVVIQTKGIIKKLLDRVNDAVEVCEANEK